MYKNNYNLVFNPILLFLFLLGVGLCLASIAVYVRHLFSEKFILRYMMLYLVACAEILTCIEVAHHIGWEEIPSMMQCIIGLGFVTPIYLLILLLIKKDNGKSLID
jgi:hypothetical protein